MTAQVAHPESIVETDWVAEHAGDDNVVLVEVDVDTAAYEQGHIPGAIGWNWTTQLNDTVTRDILNKEQIECLLGSSGITPDTTIVVYGDNNNWFATYAFWQLKIYGHSDVRVMNGGRIKWVNEGRDLTTDVPSVEATSYSASDADLSTRARATTCSASPGERPRRRWWTCERLRSSAASFWPRQTCLRKVRSAAATYQERRTSPG